MSTSTSLASTSAPRQPHDLVKSLQLDGKSVRFNFNTDLGWYELDMASAMDPTKKRDVFEVTRGKKWDAAVKEFALETGINEGKLFRTESVSAPEISGLVVSKSFYV